MKPVVLLTPDQVAQRLQVARSTVLDLLRAGHLAGVKVGPQWRVEPAALETYIADRRQVAAMVTRADRLALRHNPPAAVVAAAQGLMPRVRRFV